MLGWMSSSLLLSTLLKTNEFSLASYLRLGVALLFTNWIRKCDCGHDLDEYGYHLLTCKYGVDLCGLTIQS